MILVAIPAHVFVGLGSNDNGNLGDWWAYDIAADSWSIRAPFTWGDRHHPFYFGIDGIAYVGFGHGDSENGDLTIYKDFHAYDPASDSWTQLNDFPGEARVAGTDEIKFWVMSWGAKAQVLSPESLRNEIISEAENTLKNYHTGKT